MRADYEHALDAYDRSKSLMAQARHPHDVRDVTESLADGRHALAVLAALPRGPPASRAAGTLLLRLPATARR